MNAAQLVFVAIVFVSITLAQRARGELAEAEQHRQRLKLLRGTAASPVPDGAPWGATLSRLIGPFARLSVPGKENEQSALRLRLMHAGYRAPRAMLLYFAAKSVLALAAPGLLFILLQFARPGLSSGLQLALLLLVAALAYYLPNVVLARLVERRQRQIFESFPDAADLMLVCVESGLGLDAAMQRVTDEIRLKSRALAEELQLVNLEVRAGSARAQALRNLAARTGVEEVVTFSTMLVQADRFGTSIGDSLRVFSDEMRSRRHFRAEELAAKIPLKLLFPLVFFIFPSLMLVLLGPAFIQVYRVLIPTMGGH